MKIRITTIVVGVALWGCFDFDLSERKPAREDTASTDSGRDTESSTDLDADTDSDTDVDADSDADADTDPDTDTNMDTDTDTDADADSDGDSDADGDSDTDGDSDMDSETGPPTECSDLIVTSETGWGFVFERRQLQLTAECIVAGVSIDITEAVTWTCDSPMASVSNEEGSRGLVDGLTRGWASITAVYGDLSSPPFTVSVLANDVTGVSITPETGTITTVSGRFEFTGWCTYQDDIVEDCSNDLLWSVWDGSIATISAGTVTAIQNGQTTVSALLEAQNIPSQNNASLTVDIGRDCTNLTISTGGRNTMVEQTTLQATAFCVFGAGAGQDVTTAVDWHSSVSAVAAVASDGLITAGAVDAPLQTALNATYTNSGGQVSSNTINLTVTPRILTGIEVSQTSGIITTEDGFIQLEAICSYNNDQEEPCTDAVSWGSSDRNVATVDDSGRVDAVANGEATITARVGLISSDEVRVTVAFDGVCTALTISTGDVTTMVERTTLQASAFCDFSTGETVNVTGLVDWDSSNESAAVVSRQGMVYAQSVTDDVTTVLSATYDNADGGPPQPSDNTITMTVTPRTLVEVTVTPPSGEIHTMEESVQFNATCIYDNTESAPCTQLAEWSPTTGEVATITGGLAEPVANGTIDVTATVDGVTSEPAELIVDLGLVCQSVTIAGPTEVPLGETVELTVTCLDEDSVDTPVTDRVTWQSDDEDVLTVAAQDGTVFGAFPGTTSVQVTYRNADNSLVSDSHEMTVPTEVIDIIITPATPPDLPIGLTQIFSATCVLNNDTDSPCSDMVTWESADEEIAAFTSESTVTGVTLGEVDITATFNDLTSDAVPLTVVAPVLNGITVTPADATIEVNGTEPFGVVACTLSDDSPTPCPEVDGWASSAPEVATVDAEGIATGQTEGTTAITATIGGVTSDPVTLTVSGFLLPTGCVEPIVFAAPALDAAVRTALVIPSDQDLLYSDVYTLAALTVADSDIVSLAGIQCLDNLEQLDLQGNQIADISLLSRLPELFDLDLRGNLIDDITPLAANPGLDAGDLVDLAGNPLDCEDLDTLDAVGQLLDAGVVLTTDCNPVDTDTGTTGDTGTSTSTGN